MPTLRLLHRWIGLALAIPLLIQGISGFLIAIIPPFAAIAVPIAASSGDAPHGVGPIVAAAQAAGPSGLAPLRYQPGATDRATATVDLAQPGERMVALRVFVDPASLRVLAALERPDRVYRFAHSVHETLLIPGPVGHQVIGWFGLGLLALGLTGIPIVWPRHGRWKAALTIPAGARGYRFQRALHGAAGFWLVALLLLQSLSGASMAFPRSFGALLGVTPFGDRPVAEHPSRTGGRSAPPLASAGSPSGTSSAEVPRRETPPDPDAIVAAAQVADPGTRLVALRYPFGGNRAVTALLVKDGQDIGAPAAIVAVDPATMRARIMRDPYASWGATVLGWLRALHSGEGLGIGWRAIVCLLGLALPLFPVTGFIMWLLRRRERNRRSAERAALLQGASE